MNDKAMREMDDPEERDIDSLKKFEGDLGGGYRWGPVRESRIPKTLRRRGP